MADRYVWDGSAQDDSDSTWNSSTIAYLTFGAAMSAAVAGDVIAVADDHSETFSPNTSYTSPSGATDAPVIVYSADRTDDSYSIAAAVQIDGSAGNGDLGFNGYAMCFGCWFHAGDKMHSGSGDNWVFEDCTFASDDDWAPSEHDSTFRFVNCTIDFPVSSGFYIQVDPNGIYWEWDGCTFTESNSSTDLVQFNGGREGNMFMFRGCDFSALGMSNIVDFGSTSAPSNRVELYNCKLPAGVTAIVNRPSKTSNWLKVNNCDDGGDIFRTEHYYANGETITVSDVTYTGTKAFDDESGSGTGTGVSHKMTSRASYTSKASPLVGIPMMERLDTTGSKTFTVEALENYSTALQDDEAWMEVRYLGTASESGWTNETTRTVADGNEANLSAGSGLGDWSGEPATGDERSVKFAKTVTVNNVGYYEIRIYLAKHEASRFLWYNPRANVT